MAKPLPDAKEFNGPWGQLSDSNWLSADCLPLEEDVTVQIERINVREEVNFEQTGETKRNYGSIKFVGKVKELGINATHKNTLRLLFPKGPKTAKGAWITLYVEKCNFFKGRVKQRVMIRPEHGRPPTVTTPQGEFMPATEPGSNG